MDSYFKGRPRKTFLGVPLGWPFLTRLALLALTSVPLWLVGQPELACVVLYPLAAVLVAMMADHEKTRHSQHRM